MTLKSLLLLASTAAALGVPAVALAQSYGDQDQRENGYDRPQSGYDRPRYGDERQQYDRYHDGDYYQSSRGGSGPYPQFRGIEQHIHSEIYRGLREDMIERDGARDLLGQLRDIQVQEWREYRVHGSNLPYEDQARIRERFSELDRLVDQSRNEQ